jgi:hypothetical protein
LALLVFEDRLLTRAPQNGLPSGDREGAVDTDFRSRGLFELLAIFGVKMTRILLVRIFPAILAAATLAAAADLRQLPGQAGNDDIDLTASVLVTRDEIQEALGADIGAGYIVIRVKATPKAEQPLRIGPDDFTFLSRKDGQRSQALAPNQVAGSGGAMVVKSTQAPQRKSSILLGGLGGGMGSGNSGAGNTGVDVKMENGETKTSESPLMAALKAKVLPDKETKQPTEGLLYFPLDGKIKSSDVALIYKGPAGRLIIEFQNPKRGR